MVSKFGNWAKYSEFGKKFEFHPFQHRHIGHAGKNWEKSEKSVTRHFFWFWQLSTHKISANFILTKFWDILLANIVSTQVFSIFQVYTYKSGFFFQKFLPISHPDHEKSKNQPKWYFLLIECRETWSEWSLHLFCVLKAVKPQKSVW